MDCIVHGILQAKILEWVVFPSPGDLPNPETESRSPTLQADSLLAEPQGKPKNTGVGSLSLLQWIKLLVHRVHMCLVLMLINASSFPKWMALYPHQYLEFSIVVILAILVDMW